MKAPASKQTKWWLGGAALLAFLSWYGFGLMTEAEPTPVSGNVVVYGQVAKQGTYTWRQGMTARELISDAGGTTAFAKTRSVKVIAPKTAGHVKLGRKIQGWVAAAVNGTNDHVDSAWKACGLPGTSPHFRMQTPSNLKAILDLRKPSVDVALLPGDVVIVEEKLINF